MSLIFLDYYSTTVFGELQKAEGCDEGEVVIEDYVLGDEIVYYSLDGVNTGQALESLLESNQYE